MLSHCELKISIALILKDSRCLSVLASVTLRLSVWVMCSMFHFHDSPLVPSPSLFVRVTLKQAPNPLITASFICLN